MCWRLPTAISGRRVRHIVIVYAVVDDALSPHFPLGVELEVFIRREDAERCIEEVRGDEPDVAANLRIEEREQEPGRLCTTPPPRSLRRPGMCAKANGRTDPTDAARGDWLGASRPNGRGCGGRARVPAPQQGSAKVVAQT